MVRLRPKGGKRRGPQRPPSRFNYDDSGAVELKTLDFVQTASPTMTDSGTIILMNGCIQGTNSSQRIGTKIIMKRFFANFAVNVPNASLNTGTGYQGNSDVVRVAVVYDKQPNGAFPTYAQIWNTSGNDCAALALPSAGNSERFSILAQRNVLLVQDNNMKTGTLEHRCRLATRFNSGNAGDVTDINTGALYFVVVDQNTTANLPGTYSLNTRVEYEDM